LVQKGVFHDGQPVLGASLLILDGQTLKNLEVFANSFDEGEEGTLFKLLNHASSPFGISFHHLLSKT